MNMVNQVTPYGTLTYRRANTLNDPPAGGGSSGGSAATGATGSGKNLYDTQGRLIFDSFGNYYGSPSMFQRNMKVSRIPISAWNLMWEKIQKPTLRLKVTQVNTTERPVVRRACR